MSRLAGRFFYCLDSGPSFAEDVHTKLKFMQELIEQIVQKTGISADKAKEVLQTVSSFVQQKFPQFAGPLNSVLGGSSSNTPNQGSSNLMGDIGSKLGF
jgi:hypothetical protein